jgi:hypothetical protein
VLAVGRKQVDDWTHTSLGIRTREEVLTPYAPCSNASNYCCEGEEWSLLEVK